jgi:hypothetical protein
MVLAGRRANGDMYSLCRRPKPHHLLELAVDSSYIRHGHETLYNPLPVS